MAAKLPISKNQPQNKAFAPAGFSPILPITGAVPVAPSATQMNFRSFPLNCRGFIIHQLTLGATNPSLYKVGINRQQPVTMIVRDVFHSDELELKSLEIYNASTTTVLDVIGVGLKGLYMPSSTAVQSIAGVGNGLFTPLATSVASLAALVTVGLTVGTVIEYVDSTTLALVSWILTLDAGSPVTGPGVTVPTDYNAATNPYVWHQV